MMIPPKLQVTHESPDLVFQIQPVHFQPRIQLSSSKSPRSTTRLKDLSYSLLPSITILKSLLDLSIVGL
ncbi:uncharacterized protein MELLADRAFT_88745 [Melampsora larici-populina 98AG31]|uniref:Uncharacterized protein n=1 Tax=Melampsora larici-populina (strain 98AG31 / pathotype 3-4-7) TaxID=747676 RepID=F4RSU3_MELLP|nr:uncharacterized protein MELLADRAFT_88745 [Melampsora larici-populina 98AG31]EGG04545.1 hypothetical protein MELLADRAFT_88745 [Melampsora larici-populina 98AG31]